MLSAARRQTRKIVRTVVAGDAFVANGDVTVTGAFVTALLRGDHGTLPGGRLTLRGVRISGDIDLSYLQWTGRLHLHRCTIDGDLVLDHARIQGEVRLVGTTVREFRATGARIDGSLALTEGCHASRGLFGLGLVVTGACWLTDARLDAPEDLPGRAVPVARPRPHDRRRVLRAAGDRHRRRCARDARAVPVTGPRVSAARGVRRKQVAARSATPRPHRAAAAAGAAVFVLLR